MLIKKENYDNIEMTEIETNKNLTTLALEYFNDWKKYYIIARANKILLVFEKKTNGKILIPDKEPNE